MLVTGYVLSLPVLETTGGILLIFGLIMWLLRQAQSVVVASLRNRQPPPKVSNRSPRVPIKDTAPISTKVCHPNGRKLTSGIGVTSHPLQHFSP